MLPNVNSDVEINNGGTATLDSANTGSARDIYLGQPMLSDGRLDVISAGKLTSLNAWIGYDGGGEALVDGVGSTWTNNGKVTVGNSLDSAKHGELSIREGGSVTFGTTVIGSQNNSIGSILAEGTSAQLGALTIGERGTGTLQINQGTVQSTGVSIAKFKDSDQTANDKGEAFVAGGTWTISGSLYVGEGGNGNLEIESGGTVTAGTTVLGSLNDSMGSILVNGSSLQVGFFTIGERGAATFQVTNGTIQSGFTTIGKFEDTDSTPYVAEAIMNSGTWTLTSGMYVGDDGIGKLQINGGTMNTSFYTTHIGRQEGSDGEVTIGSGGTLSSTGAMYVGDAGKARLTINAGSVKVQTGGLTIGRLANADGEVKVSGNRIWELGGIDIGELGRAKLTVENGATLKSNAGSIGSYTTTKDSVVSFTGSTWEDSGELQVLNRSTLTFNNAIWTMTATSTDPFDPTVQLDGDLATRPKITLNNSMWTNAGGLRNDTGKITIGAGSTVTNTFGMLAFDSSDDAEVEVDGGTWESTGRLTVGAGGKALLTVKNSGLVKSNTAIIADDASSIASVIVDGAGSRWENTGLLEVGDTNGPGTQGTLILRNGGEVSSTGGINVVGQGFLGGVGTITGAVANLEIVDPGYYDEVADDTVQGTLHITGNYTQFGASKLQISLAATGHDKLDIDGTISLLSATDLDVSFDEGFNPSAGQSWDILDWGTASSNFASRFNANLPALDGNETWDLSQLYTSGVIAVASTAMVPGDFNGNGAVDAADYVHLRKTNAAPDAYHQWRANFGRTSAAAEIQGSEMPVNVPEPAAGALAAFGVILVALGRYPSCSPRSGRGLSNRSVQDATDCEEFEKRPFSCPIFRQSPPGSRIFRCTSSDARG
jgi:T5SS/PEP-CTERM-associated repeat protein